MSNFKTLAAQNIFHVLVHFGKLETRSTTFMLKVFLESNWILVKNGHENGEKNVKKTHETFSKCLENSSFDFLLTFFHIFYS